MGQLQATEGVQDHCTVLSANIGLPQGYPISWVGLAAHLCSLSGLHNGLEVLLLAKADP